MPQDPRVEPPAILSPPKAGGDGKDREPPPVAAPPSPLARRKGNAGSPFIPAEPMDPPKEEVPEAMPPAPNSIGEVVAPPMAGDAGRDDPNVPWPDERGKAE
eukprot:1143249-Alexandrium_andersonii.AAC.1